MSGKSTGSPRSEGGSGVFNSRSELTLSSTVPHMVDSLEHNAGPDSMQGEEHQITLGRRTSAVEKGGTGDGVYYVERRDPPGMEHPATSENSAERSEESSTTSSEQLLELKRLARFNGEINRMSTDQLHKKLAELHLNARGVREVLKKRLKNVYRREELPEANRLKGVAYDFVVVVDFEATCRENNDNFVHEIIEFPAVLVEVEGSKIVGMFREFCKPVLNPVLTKFCKSLTGVNQTEVDSASEFPGVVERFEKWLNAWGLGTRHTFCVVTDGPWDIHRFLSTQCQISQLPMPQWSRQWINIRKTYRNFYSADHPNMSVMLQNLGLRFEGRPHCGLDDSKNIARIVCHMLEDGSVLKVNEKLDHGQPDLPGKPRGTVDPGDGTPRGECKFPPQKTVCSRGVCASSKSTLGSMAVENPHGCEGAGK